MLFLRQIKLGSFLKSKRGAGILATLILILIATLWWRSSRASRVTRQIVAKVVKKYRKELHVELNDFRIPEGKAIREFIPETNGRPLRNIIVSTWRSGSTFLGDVLSATPGTFYHSDPLSNFGVMQIRGEPLASDAISNLKKLLKCDYTELDDYLHFCRIHSSQFSRNKWLRNLRKTYKKHFYKSEVVGPICQLFPWQTMKLQRMRLNVAAKLLEDEEE